MSLLECVLYVKQFKRWRPKDLYERLYQNSNNSDGIDLNMGEFNARHKMHDKWETIQKDNRQSHMIEIIEERGGNTKYEHTKVSKENAELKQWLKDNHDEAWRFIRSQRAFNIYKNYEDIYDLPKEDVYDI